MSPLRIAGTVLGAVLTLAAAWFAWAFTYAMVTARARPAASIAAWPTDGALAAAASAAVAGEQNRRGAALAVRLGEAALRRSPVNAEAARNVALGRLATGDLAAARRIIAAGEALSRRDVPTQLWLIEDRVAAGDVVAALAHYDRALRTSPDSRAVLLPVLAQAADDPAIARPLARRLAARPEWWSDFLGRFVATGTSPPAFRLIADGLRLDPRSDVDHERLAAMLARLVEIGQPRAARAMYDRFTGTRGAGVIDGGFERDRGLPPFDWQLVDEADRSAAREPRDGAAGTALGIAGTEGKEVARQLLVLAPGRYRLSARTGAVAAETTTPPSLTIACAGAGGTTGAELASAPFPIGAAPRRWAVEVMVPAGCASQWLSIASASNVGYLSDSPWIDDVSLAPVR